jgi:DNA-directed RNA polymerase subunit RPC12/RpoP
MVDEKRLEENIEWLCPHCRHRYRAPLTAAVSTRCAYCGKEFYTSGIEVENRESSKLHEEIRKRRKRELNADTDRE